MRFSEGMRVRTKGGELGTVVGFDLSGEFPIVLVHLDDENRVVGYPPLLLEIAPGANIDVR